MASHFESRNKFSVSNPRVTNIFTEDQFFKWSEGNIYRTSTNYMTPGKVKPNLLIIIIVFCI